MMIHRHSPRALLLLSLALPRAAWSQPAPAPASTAEVSATQRETARAWAKEGSRLFDQKDYAGALERYSAAYRLVRAPTVGIKVAQTQEALGKLVEANATAVEVMNLPVAPDEPEVFASSRASARKLLERLTPLVPALRVDVTPRDAVARVSVDAEELLAVGGQLSFKLNPGKHELVVSAPGYRTVTRSLILREQDRHTAAITLTPEPRPVAASTPPAAAPSRSELRSSRSELEDTRPSASGTPTLAYVALGTAGVATLVGSVTGILAFTTKPDCPNDHCFPEQRDDANASRRNGNVATVSFGVALVAGAYGLWELLSQHPESTARRAPAAEARLVPLPSGALLEYSGELF
jgi:hypothetical protein